MNARDYTKVRAVFRSGISITVEIPAPQEQQVRETIAEFMTKVNLLVSLDVGSNRYWPRRTL
jgi:hypothetical protein